MESFNTLMRSISSILHELTFYDNVGTLESPLLYFGKLLSNLVVQNSTSKPRSNVKLIRKLDFHMLIKNIRIVMHMEANEIAPIVVLKFVGQAFYFIFKIWDER